MRRNYWREFVIVVLFLALCAGWVMFGVSRYQEKNVYGMTAVVTHISEATNTVTIKDFNGNLWQFKGVEDWNIGDVASCVMDSKGTDLIKDDVIIKVQYSGYFEGWN